MIEAWHRLLAADPAATVARARRLDEEFVQAGITYGGGPLRTLLRPHFVAGRDWDLLRTTGRRLIETAVRVARFAFDGDAGRLCGFLGTPAAEVPWVTTDPGPPDVLLSRLDAFVTPEGPRFIEINSDAPAGFGYGDRMAEVFARLDVFPVLARERAVRYVPSSAAVVDAVLGLWRARGGVGAPVVAIVDWQDVPTRPDQEILRETFAVRGVSCLLADPREAEIAGRRLRFRGRGVDVVYRRALLDELVARGDESRAFLESCRRGLALLANSFRCRLSEDKALFAILTDEAFAHLLTAEERDLMLRVLPWTRRVAERRTTRRGAEIDLVPHVLSHREELVLKPAHSFGGRSVLVGPEVPASAWEEAVRAGLGEPWVVQERVPIPEERFPVLDGDRLSFEPLKVNVSPFWVAGHAAGAVTRASRSSVINVGAGGGSVPTFVVD